MKSLDDTMPIPPTDYPTSEGTDLYPTERINIEDHAYPPLSCQVQASETKKHAGSRYYGKSICDHVQL